MQNDFHTDSHAVFSNKTKYLDDQKKLNILTTKDYKFLIGRRRFLSDEGSQNMFAYQPTLDNLEIKKYKCTNYVLS